MSTAARENRRPSHLADLWGKTALVTGATRGIGRALALGLSRAGVTVLVAGRSPSTAGTVAAEIRSTTGHRAIGIRLDVCSPRDELAGVIDSATGMVGEIDILVNNAGVITRSPSVELSADDWQSVVHTNLTGTFDVTRIVGARMLSVGRGRIINITSVLAFSGGRSVVAYAATKGAVAQLTRALAVEWAASGVTVNAIAAGYIRTDLTAALQLDPARSQEILARVPAGRWGEPNDLVGPVCFLASDMSAYVNGAVLAVDGGWLAA
ncbi:SDR family oxidoreductase [Nocardia beijingensis]|uniref:SDR family oxidoreductase n=1 Tax=Nocardia beijingensis TaxID=95162 RepID=A0ABW7W830_9NOCA